MFFFVTENLEIPRSMLIKLFLMSLLFRERVLEKIIENILMDKIKNDDFLLSFWREQES